MAEKRFYLNKVLGRVGRNKTARDSRGWRCYTEGEIESIIKLIKNTNYFRESRVVNYLQMQREELTSG